MAYITNEEIVEKIDSLIDTYRGDGHVLATVIGVLFIGKRYGWKVLRIVFSNASYTKYQRVLGLDFKTIFPATTAISERSMGFKLVESGKNFWNVVRGTASVDPEKKSVFA